MMCFLPFHRLTAESATVTDSGVWGVPKRSLKTQRHQAALCYGAMHVGL